MSVKKEFLSCIRPDKLVFRLFMDQLVKSEDSEIFVQASCLLELQEWSVGCLSDPEQIRPDSGHDQTQSQYEKVKRTTQVTRALRAQTSRESLCSYEQMKAEKHFNTSINLRHINKLPFTRLLRVGTDACCHFNEATR